MTITPEEISEIFETCPELEPRYESHDNPGYMSGISWIPEKIAVALTQARKERDELKEALAVLGWERTENRTLVRMDDDLDKTPF